MINCRKCEQSLYLEKIERAVGVTDFCPHCKTVMSYYLCPCCKEFSEGVTSCKNKQCLPPISVIDNTVDKKKKAEEK